MIRGITDKGEIKTAGMTEDGAMKVAVVSGGEGGDTGVNTETTLNASVQTVGTTATSISINKKVTTIDIANYSESANITLTIDNASYVIGSSIATTLTINKDVTNISLISTEADTKIQLVVKGISSGESEPTYELDFNQILEDGEGTDNFIVNSGQDLEELFTSLDVEEVATVIEGVPTDEERHTFKVECSDITIYGEVLNISNGEIPGINVYTNNKNVSITIQQDPETGDNSVVVTDINN